MTHDARPPLAVAAAVALLVIRVSGLRHHAFLALLLVTEFLRPLSGMPVGIRTDVGGSVGCPYG